MKRMIVFVGVVVSLLSIVGAGAQQLTDADVEAAIKAGQSKKFDHLLSECLATIGFGEGVGASLVGGVKPTGPFNVTVSANAGRIAFLAADAKRLYKPFTLADIPDTLRAPNVFVAVEPDEPGKTSSGIAVSSPIERVIFKSKAKPDVVAQPETFETEAVEWSNLLGGMVVGNRVFATFSVGAVRELPPGDFDVVVITQAGERKCKVGSKDRAKLFPASR